MGLFHVWYADTGLLPRDIYPLQYGEQECDSGYGYGPCIRNFYFLHYVYSGRGYLLAEGKRHEIAGGQYFLIYPGQLAYYEADRKEPWMYRWVEVSGAFCGELLSAAGFSKENPVLSDRTGEVGKAVAELTGAGHAEFSLIMGKLWGLVHAMTDGRMQDTGKGRGSAYVRKCENYMRMNLHKKIRVTELAAYAGIDRSYLSRIFREQKGQSPQQYLLKLKMETAAQHLKNKEISIKEAALCVGYDDPLEFSKQFRRHFQVSPGEWRRQQFYEQSVNGYRRMEEDVPE